jgi:hypothetical protein
MGKPNTLSCRADYRLGKRNNDNLTLLSLTIFHIHVLSGKYLEGDEHNILKEVRWSLQHDALEEPVAMAAYELCKEKIEAQ